MKSGLTLLEVIISLGVLSLLIAGIFPTLGWLITRSRRLTHSSQASMLLSESLEVAYNVFLGDWEKFGPGVYHPALKSSGGGWIWTLLPGPAQAEARFDRQVVVEPVCRKNGTGELVDSSGCNAPNTSLDSGSYWLTSSVSWAEPAGEGRLQAKLLITRLSGP